MDKHKTSCTGWTDLEKKRHTALSASRRGVIRSLLTRKREIFTLTAKTGKQLNTSWGLTCSKRGPAQSVEADNIWAGKRRRSFYLQVVDQGTAPSRYSTAEQQRSHVVDQSHQRSNSFTWNRPIVSRLNARCITFWSVYSGDLSALVVTYSTSRMVLRRVYAPVAQQAASVTRKYRNQSLFRQL